MTGGRLVAALVLMFCAGWGWGWVWGVLYMIDRMVARHRAEADTSD
jgi:hypothetical protein